jgi:hypothetical protein
MTGLVIQTWVLPLIGVRSALVYCQVMEVLDALRVLGNSYRLASLGVCSAAVYARFIFDFCRAAAASSANSGMAAFGLFALPPLIRRGGHE